MEETEYIPTDEFGVSESAQDVPQAILSIQVAEELRRATVAMSVLEQVDITKPNKYKMVPIEGFRVTSVTQAERILSGFVAPPEVQGEQPITYLPMYTRHKTEDLSRRYSRVEYKLKGYADDALTDAMIDTTYTARRMDEHIAAQVLERLQFEDILNILQAVYNREAAALAREQVQAVQTTGTSTSPAQVVRLNKYISSVFCKVSQDGRPVPEKTYIDARYFIPQDVSNISAIERMSSQVATEVETVVTLPVKDVLNRYGSTSTTTETTRTSSILANLVPNQARSHLLDMLEKMSSDMGDSGYGWQPMHNNMVPTKIIATGFGVVIKNTYTSTSLPTLPITGYTDKQERLLKNIIQNASSFTPKVSLVDMDISRKGYCLIETMSKLAGIDPEIVLNECGNPYPYDLSLEKWADIIANIVRANYLFYRLVGNGKKIAFYAKTATSYTKTYNLLMIRMPTTDDPTGEQPINRHILAMFYEQQETTPFATETVFISYDLETYYDKEAINRSYALSALVYRVAPTPVAFQSYNERQQIRALQVLTTLNDKTKSAEWKPVYNINGDLIKPDELIRYARVIFEPEGHAIDDVIDIIVRVRDTIAQGKQLNIVFTGFNIARFDNFYLLEALAKTFSSKGGIVTPVMHGNKLVNIKVSCSAMQLNISTYDMRCQMTGSLAQTCDNYGVPAELSKKSLEHGVVQMCYNMEPHKFGEFIEANHEVLDTYCRYDVVSCMLLHNIYKACTERVVNTYMIEHYNASLGYIALCTREYIDARRSCYKHIAKIDKAPDKQSKQSKEKVVVKDVLSNIISRIHKADHNISVDNLVNEFRTRVTKMVLHLGYINAEVKTLIYILQVLASRGYESKEIPINLSKCISTLIGIEGRFFNDIPSIYNTLTEVQQKGIGPIPTLNCNQSIELLEYTTKRLTRVLGLNILPATVGYITETEDVEQYATSPSYDDHIQSLFDRINRRTRARCLRTDAAQILKNYSRIAGRSQAKIGVFEDTPYVLADMVSQYPTAMSNPHTAYPLGEQVVTEPDKIPIRINCEYTNKYVEPINGVIQPALYKVLVHSQPKGVVLPTRDSTGYHWDYDHGKETYYLIYGQDVESLKTTGAQFDIIDGIKFNISTTELFKEYIAMWAVEKNIQDRLKVGDKTAQRYPGELYSKGARETSKNALNSLSGKQVQRIYTDSIKITNTAEEAETQDFIGGVRQNKCLKRLEKENKELKESRLSSDPNRLNRYRKVLAQYNSIERLVEPPSKVTDGLFISRWKAIPIKASSDDVTGNIIYATARYMMNRIYNTIDFDMLLTETDSVMFKARDLSKIYPLESYMGDPLVYSEVEHRLGLYDGIPDSKESKKFGQLELETTELLTKLFTESMIELTNNINYTITSLRYNGDELVLDGIETHLSGPYVACAGKKIYVIYLKDRNGDRVYLKTRFKGVTLGKDWVISQTGINKVPELYTKMISMSSHDKLIYLANELECVKKSDIHKAGPDDIFDMIKYGRLYVIQTRVAIAEVTKLVTRQDVVVKVIELSGKPETLSTKQTNEIQERNILIRDTPMYALAHVIKHGVTYNNTLCLHDNKQATCVINGQPLCDEHKANVSGTESCMVLVSLTRGYCGKPTQPGNIYCEDHKKIYDINELGKGVTKTQCKYIAPSGILCTHLISKTAIKNGVHRCKSHYKLAIGFESIPCLHGVQRGIGNTICSKPSCVEAVNKGLRLCSLHWYIHKEKQDMTPFKIIFDPEQPSIPKAALILEQHHRSSMAMKERDIEIKDISAIAMKELKDSSVEDKKDVCTIDKTIVAHNDIRTCYILKEKQTALKDDKIRVKLCDNKLTDEDIAKGYKFCMNRHRRRIYIGDVSFKLKDQVQPDKQVQGIIATSIQQHKENSIITQANEVVKAPIIEQQLENKVTTTTTTNTSTTVTQQYNTSIEIKCQAILKSGAKRGQACGRTAYIIIQGQARCGIHDKH